MDGQGIVCSLDTPDKGMVHDPGGMAERFIMLFVTASNLKLMNCLFLEFSI